MIAHLRRAIVSIVVITIFFGFVYAFAGTGVAQLFFKHQADGSITANGSTLIGQNWSDTICPGHPLGSCVFQGRPDDLGPYAAQPRRSHRYRAGTTPSRPAAIRSPTPAYRASPSATNLGPRSKTLLDNTKALVAYWHARGVNPTPDLVTTSGSGIDPDITPQDAIVQIPMVSKATGIATSVLRALIAKETHGEQLGFLGSSYIVVLQLNEALAALRH